MSKVNLHEARQLLSQRLTCEDSPDWAPLKGYKGFLSTSCGLLDTNGKSTRLIADLEFRRSPKTNVIRYVFSVYRRELRQGLERVYQLDVSQWPRPVKDLHQLPHEHMGDERTVGADHWSKWTYEEVLAYFCAQTNITFIPVVPHPEELRLKGQK
ncbi:MAG TPA: hypothetical protein DD803_04395 [Alcaligenes faecalis]|nr:hypothetical protein [Alcaligenes faecalis]